MKRSWFLILSVIVALSLVLSACSSGAGSSTKPKIRVASEAAYPPFETVDEKTKELVGFDIDLMKAIADKAGYEVEFKNTPFDSVLAGIATCQFDAAISAITITEERKKTMNFSDPYIDAGQIVTVRTDNTTINGPADLKGKKVAVQLGTTGEIEAKKIEGVTVKPFDTVDLAFLELKNGQVDATIIDNPTTLVYVARFKELKTVGKPFTDEHYGIAVCNKNPELLTKINTALAALKADGSVQKFTDKWLSTTTQ
jgi:polar amino acid transport system substrate-binding protein